MSIDEAKPSVAEEAYQVIGAIADRGGLFHHPEVQRALDYFSADTQDGSILPFAPPKREDGWRDMVRLVVAARVVAFEDQGPEAVKALDKAVEAFADRVPWENEP